MKLAKEKLALVSPALFDGQEDSHGCSMKFEHIPSRI